MTPSTVFRVPSLARTTARTAFLALALCATPLLGGNPADAAVEPDLMLTAFQTPSGNITCMLGAYPSGVSANPDEQFVRCDIRRTAQRLPRRPADCDLDWGPVVSLGSKGAATFGACVGDAVGPGKTLGYGKSIRRGPFTCVSRTTGLTCSTSRHGFVASRESVRTY